MVAAAVAVGWSGAPAAGAGDDGRRAEARVLDGLPLPPGAEASDVRDRRREYLVASSAAETMAYLRTALPNAGWTERAASSAPTQTTGSNTGGQGPTPSTGSTGESGAGGSSGGGVESGNDETLPQRMRTVYTRSGDRLVVVVRPIADGDPQTGTSADNAQDQSTLRLRVRVD